MTKDKSAPPPLETNPGQQRDDNIDDFGRRQDGATLDQPLSPEKPASDEPPQLKPK